MKIAYLTIEDITSGLFKTQILDIIEEISKLNVAVNVHFKPVPMMTYYKNKGYNIADYPVAYDNYQREISLPVYYGLSDAQIETVLNAVIASVEKVVHV